MRIVNVQPEQFNILQEFLTQFEFSCVQLGSLVRKKDERLFAVITAEKLESVSDIYGIFSFDGSIHHCFPYFGCNQLLFSEFAAVFLDFLDKQNRILKCMNGLAGTTDLILSILKPAGLVPYQINYYKLMLLNKKPEEPPESLCNEDFIKHCTINDFDDLYELQENYLVEEVAPRGKKISRLESSASLKQILKNQICNALVTDGEFAAKANTNAISWNYVQIGGVYTKNIYRRNYYAWHLIYDLCKLLQNKNKKVCLFVKECNYPADSLYEKIGFSAVDRFEICYF